MEDRITTMNPTAEEYAAQIDLHMRKFSVQKAIEAHSVATDMNIIILAKKVYEFLKTGDVKPD